MGLLFGDFPSRYQLETTAGRLKKHHPFIADDLRQLSEWKA
jgi:hypothetical protein